MCVWLTAEKGVDLRRKGCERGDPVYLKVHGRPRDVAQRCALIRTICSHAAFRVWLTAEKGVDLRRKGCEWGDPVYLKVHGRPRDVLLGAKMRPYTRSTQSNVQRHHYDEPRNHSPRPEVRIVGKFGIGDQVVGDDEDHRARRECQELAPAANAKSHGWTAVSEDARK